MKRLKIIMMDFVGIMFVFVFLTARHVNSAPIIDSGTSEPATPVTGEQYYRTDLHAHEIYDGQWIRQDMGVWNVKAFGAKGDGATDDRNAIQLAVNSAANAGGGIVYVPAGTYMIGGVGIKLLENVSIMGAGMGKSVLKMTAGRASDTHLLENDSTFFGNKRLIIADLTLDGNKANQTATGLSLIRFTKVTFSTIRNCELIHGRQHGIDMTDSNTDNLIIGNVIDDFGLGSVGFGIVAITNSHRNRVIGNWIRSQETGGGVTGIGIDDVSTGQQGISPSNENIVMGNTIVNTGIGIMVEGSHRNIIEGNTITNPISIGIQVDEGQNLIAPIDNRVVNNVVVGPTTGQAQYGAIHVDGIGTVVENNSITSFASPANGILVSNISSGNQNQHIRIIGNQIDNTGITLSGAGILVKEGRDVSITGNRITNIDQAPGINGNLSGDVAYLRIRDNYVAEISRNMGIVVDSTGFTLKDVEITDNIVVNVSKGNPAGDSGIVVAKSTGTLDRVRVCRNRIIDDQATPTTKFGVLLSGNPTNVEVIRNQVAGTTNGAVSGAPDGVNLIPGISAGSTASRNLRGQSTLNAGTGSLVVTFPTPEVDASYYIQLTGNGNQTLWVTNKTATGFTINRSSTTGTRIVDWLLIR